MFFGFENVTVAYKNRRVLDGVTVDIPKGEIVTVIGKNGCGKSSLLKTVFGAVHPQGGRVLLEGKPLNSYPNGEAAKRIGYLAQTHSTPPGMDVRSLVACGRFPCRRKGSGFLREDERVIDETLQMTGLFDLQSRALNTLSGGERQRAWIAMAVCRRPQILILDEPTTYLDIGSRLEVLELIRRLNREQGMTVLMVLHDLNTAARYSDRIVVLHDGKVYRQGAPNEVLCKETLETVFGIEARVLTEAGLDRPVVIPLQARKEEEA